MFFNFKIIGLVGFLLAYLTTALNYDIFNHYATLDDDEDFDIDNNIPLMSRNTNTNTFKACNHECEEILENVATPGLSTPPFYLDIKCRELGRSVNLRNNRADWIDPNETKCKQLYSELEVTPANGKKYNITIHIGCKNPERLDICRRFIYPQRR